jgi:hypothetical protein
MIDLLLPLSLAERGRGVRAKIRVRCLFSILDPLARARRRNTTLLRKGEGVSRLLRKKIWQG